MPEDSNADKTTVPTMSAEQQLAQLRKKLAGHRAFRNCRSKFGAYNAFKLLELSTPTETLEAFERWVGNQRVMLNWLALLKRKSQWHAHRELLAALFNSDHVITGETIPLDLTEPGVLVMFDLKKTLLLARWLYSSTWEDGNHWVTTGAPDPERAPCGSLTARLLEVFPELRDSFKKKEAGREVSPTKAIHPLIKAGKERLRAKFGDGFEYIWIDPDRTGLWYYENCVAMFVPGATQKDVRSCFERNVQSAISTWSFQYPKVLRPKFALAGRGPSMWIGLHPEAEHAAWKKQWPSFASKGCSGGYGAVILEKEMMERPGYGEAASDLPFTPYEALHAPYPQFYLGDIEQKRLVLGFPYNR